LDYKVSPEVHVGHIHLVVADLDRSLKFYKDLLGFEISCWFGKNAVFLSAGGYHHHIGLNTWSGSDATPPPAGHTGLYHFAILYPSRKELAKILKRLLEVNYPIQGASDHGVSESIYLTDPDGIGIELYRDRHHEDWPVNTKGELTMITKPLDVMGLLEELDDE
jgi:catechol 2,3-dioxygenase